MNNFNNHQNANFKIEEYNTIDTNNNSHNINNNLKLIAQPEAVKRLRTRNNKSLSISQFEPISQKYLNDNYEKEQENKIKITNFAPIIYSPKRNLINMKILRC